MNVQATDLRWWEVWAVPILIGISTTFITMQRDSFQDSLMEALSNNSVQNGWVKYTDKGFLS